MEQMLWNIFIPERKSLKGRKRGIFMVAVTCYRIN